MQMSFAVPLLSGVPPRRPNFFMAALHGRRGMWKSLLLARFGRGLNRTTNISEPQLLAQIAVSKAITKTWL